MTGTSQSGFLIQTTFGPINHANIEFVVPDPQTGFNHFWRNSDLTTNQSPADGWQTGAQRVGVQDPDQPNQQLHYNYVSLIQSTFGQYPSGNYGNFEAIGVVGPRNSQMNWDSLVHVWRTYNPSATPPDDYPWAPPYTAIEVYERVSGATVPVPIYSNPAFIQSTFGNQGNFELVIAASRVEYQGPPHDDSGKYKPHHDNGLVHWWRDNDSPPQPGQKWPWQSGEKFALDLQFNAVALIQSHFESLSFTRLDVVARSGNQLFHYWRDPATGRWIAYPADVDNPMGLPIVTNATGVPALIQGRFGAHGNFELVTPITTGGIRHIWFDTNSSNPDDWRWKEGEVLDGSLGSSVDRVSIIQTRNLPTAAGLGDLVVIDGSRNLYWRSDQGIPSGPWPWNGPSLT